MCNAATILVSICLLGSPSFWGSYLKCCQEVAQLLHGMRQPPSPPPPPPPPPFLPHPSCSTPPTNPALTGSFLSYLLLLSSFIYIALYSYPDGGYSPSLEKHRDVADSAGRGRGRGWEWEKKRGDFYYSLTSHDVNQNKSRALLSRPCPHIFQPFKTVTKHLAPSAISAAAHDGKPLE